MYFVKALLLSLLLAGVAQAKTAGPNSQVAWDYDQARLAEIDGFRLICNGSSVWEGTAQIVQFLDLGMAPGQYECFVEAFNAIDKSGPSNTVTFPFVVEVPETPTNVRIQ